MDGAVILIALAGIIPLAIASFHVARTPRQVLNLLTAGNLAALAMAAALVAVFLRSHGPRLLFGNGLFLLDALTGLHLLICLCVYAVALPSARMYLAAEIRHGLFTLRQCRTFASLWLLALGSMLLVILCNNLAIMWAAMEATTLLTAFLIITHPTRESLEAMWKYIMICSVGVALAFLGVLFITAAAHSLPLAPREMLMWTHLTANGNLLQASFVKVGFILLLVGFGTKAGLAPMHNWLPDAHSQAPAPVSAVFSGFMLNAALYCILRYLPIAEISGGYSGWAPSLLTGFGLISVGIAAVFILFQKNLKRLLAYSSIENIGIMAFGLGLGAMGATAAFFHMLNHALVKPLAFHVAGRMGTLFRSLDIPDMAGALRTLPFHAATLLVAVLALLGMAPFATFTSKFYIIMAACTTARWWLSLLFIIFLCIIFVGFLRHLMTVVWGDPPEHAAPQIPAIAWPERALMVLPLCALLVLGLWMPESLGRLLAQAADIVRPVSSTLITGSHP